MYQAQHDIRRRISDARLARAYIERANRLTGDRLRMLEAYGRDITRGLADCAREYRRLSAAICKRAGL